MAPVFGRCMAFLGWSFLLVNFPVRVHAEPFHDVLDFQSYFQDSTFTGFPFETYATLVSIEDIHSMEKDRHTLDSMGYSGDAFINAYLTHYLAQYPLRLEDFSSIHFQVLLGQKYWLSGQILDEGIYKKLGDRICSRNTHFIDQHIDEGTLNPSDPQVIFWVEVLASLQYHTSYKISSLEKGMWNLKEGNYQYILNRVWADYRYEFLLIILSLILLQTGIIWLSLYLRPQK